jgi:AraC family transcriptional regulator
MEASGPSGRMYAESLVRALVCRYLALACNGAPVKRTSTGTLHPRLLKRLQEWMISNLHRDISLISLAEEAKYSSTHLLRAFRMSTGMTPHQYLLELRVVRAESLLRKRETRLIDVGQRVWLLKPSSFYPYLQSASGNDPRTVSSPTLFLEATFA